MKEVITKTVIEVYFAKANKVIDSCENLRQLEVARNYVNNFFTLFGNIEMISPFRVVNASAFVVQCYNELILKVEEEEKKFKKYEIR